MTSWVAPTARHAVPMAYPRGLKHLTMQAQCPGSRCPDILGTWTTLPLSARDLAPEAETTVATGTRLRIGRTPCDPEGTYAPDALLVTFTLGRPAVDRKHPGDRPRPARTRRTDPGPAASTTPGVDADDQRRLLRVRACTDGTTAQILIPTMIDSVARCPQSLRDGRGPSRSVLMPARKPT
jgi:hypothetical protein